MCTDTHTLMCTDTHTLMCTDTHALMCTDTHALMCTDIHALIQYAPTSPLRWRELGPHPESVRRETNSGEEYWGHQFPHTHTSASTSAPKNSILLICTASLSSFLFSSLLSPFSPPHFFSSLSFSFPLFSSLLYSTLLYSTLLYSTLLYSIYPTLLFSSPTLTYCALQRGRQCLLQGEMKCRKEDIRSLRDPLDLPLCSFEIHPLANQLVNFFYCFTRQYNTVSGSAHSSWNSTD